MYEDWKRICCGRFSCTCFRSQRFLIGESGKCKIKIIFASDCLDIVYRDYLTNLNKVLKMGIALSKTEIGTIFNIQTTSCAIKCIHSYLKSGDSLQSNDPLVLNLLYRI